MKDVNWRQQTADVRLHWSHSYGRYGPAEILKKLKIRPGTNKKKDFGAWWNLALEFFTQSAVVISLFNSLANHPTWMKLSIHHRIVKWLLKNWANWTLESGHYSLGQLGPRDQLSDAQLNIFQSTQIQKITGETPEVRSNKMKRKRKRTNKRKRKKEETEGREERIESEERE